MEEGGGKKGEIRESRIWKRKYGRGKGGYGKWKERRGRIEKKRCSKEGESGKRNKEERGGRID